MSSDLQFLVGSNSSDIALVRFSPSTKQLSRVASSTVGPTPSWVEPCAIPALHGKVFYAASEMAGKVLSLDLAEDGKLSVQGMGVTKGGSAHVLALKDGSGVIATNYSGGSALFYPVDQQTGHLPAASTGALASLTPSFLASHPPILHFPFTYARHGPNKDRQEASHPHQAVEGEGGIVYVPDLGSDRIWIVRKAAGEGEVQLEICGEMRLPGGAGPRHAALSPDGKHLYVLTELSHEIFIFPTPSPTNLHKPSEPLYLPIEPLTYEGYEIVPPEIPRDLRAPLNAGELIVCPLSRAHGRTLYASNRGQVDLNSQIPGAEAKGDAITVLTLSEEGTHVESHTIVRTGTNFIRGMGVSKDGRWLACVGQKDGNVEVYECQGARGEELVLVARLEAGAQDGLGITMLPTDVTWL
ncbi:hypothetical protein QFC24_006586 [Naganishia onofrii]|uniref:Uncharacterized protein n=1 Tax=Naganishia onofrii TaxID=1851511 RepID=A0ACC2WZT8_9TREE|nr:hypothetical protein QFC24_006586 [Naganishia onofrii]